MNDEQNPTLAPSEPAGVSAGATVRVDLHCHSAASTRGPLRPGQVPECATPPREVYELAKSRGMDFVTITDHDTIDGVLEIAGEPDVFVSEELTARFRDEPRAVHVLCFGITPDDHARLQELSSDVVACAEYLHDQQIACSLAHPFWNAEAPLTPVHRRLLAELFAVWETRNGKRPATINAPAATYIDTRGGGATGGSDDHAGTEIGRTFTRAPHAATAGELLDHIRVGLTTSHGAEGSAAKAAHAALAIAARTSGEPSTAVRAWLNAVELDHDTGGLVAMLQDPQPRHGELERRARRIHERGLARAARELEEAGAEVTAQRLRSSLQSAAAPAVPYVGARASLFAENKPRVDEPVRVDDEPVRVAVVADGLAGLPPVADTLEQLRAGGLPGHELELIGTDAGVDCRLPAVHEAELPFLPGIAVGVPSLFAIADALTERPYDLIHVATAGPAGIEASIVAQAMKIPVVADAQPELTEIARLYCDRSPLAEHTVRALLASHYARCRLVLSPSTAIDKGLAALDVPPARIARWEPGVDLERFHPAQYTADCLPDHGGGRFNVLYAGRLAREQGIDLVAEAFLIARDRDPRLHLVLAGSGPRESALRSRLGPAATFLGWVAAEALAQIYASADLFVHAGPPTALGGSARSILEAQASGLPVLAANGGGDAAELIESGRTGCFVEPDAEALASAIRWLARRGAIRERLATGGLLWSRSTCSTPGATRPRTASPRWRLRSARSTRASRSGAAGSARPG